MKYYLGGQEISEREANECMMIGAMSKGYWRDDIESIWQSRQHSEESREIIFEWSDYCLEIVCDE